MNQWGRDEMNLVELAFGPITAGGSNTLDISRTVFDPLLKRQVTRQTIITGSDAFGLPRPIDDQVLVGMKALTYESGFADRKVRFSRYQLCRTIGWPTDGRAYRRIEDSLNRIAGTTLQFKDAWYDKGDSEFKSKTFHLIDDLELCSRDRLERTRKAATRVDQPLCHIVWNEAVWKSFDDGFIRKLDMNLFRRIASGRRREVPIRLYRILDKRFYKSSTVRLDLKRLAVGTLGLNARYAPSQMRRIIDRAANWLVECEYLNDFYYPNDRSHRSDQVVFRKRLKRTRKFGTVSQIPVPIPEQADSADHRIAKWFAAQPPEKVSALESEAMRDNFGSPLERQMIQAKKDRGEPITASGAIRKNFVWRYWMTTTARAEQSPSHSQWKKSSTEEK